MDVSDTIKAKSDQLNADDLIGGPITVQVDKVTRANGEQPIRVHISGGHMPWYPCKTMRRVLVAAWGPDASKWHGQWLALFRDPAVRWAGEEVGGIRIKAMSGIARDMTLSLTVTRNKKKPYRVSVLRDATQQGAPTADLVALLDDAELTFDDVDAWRMAQGKHALDTLSDEEQAGFGGWLAAKPARLEAIRKHSAEAESLTQGKPVSEPELEPAVARAVEIAAEPGSGSEVKRVEKKPEPEPAAKKATKKPATKKKAGGLIPG